MTGIDHPGFVEAEKFDDPRDRELGLKVLAVLHRHYPGHPWAIQPRVKQGIIILQLMYTEAGPLGRTFGFVLDHDATDLQILMGAGEMLERWRIDRGPANDESRHRATQHGMDKTLVLK